MSKQIKIQWQDEADNETHFKIYRGSTLDMSVDDSDEIISIDWNGSAWVHSIVDSTNVSQLTDFLSGGSPTDAGGQFSIDFTDAFTGTHYYGVLAGNAVANSDIVPSTSSVTI